MPRKNKVIRVCNDMRVSKWWQVSCLTWSLRPKTVFVIRTDNVRLPFWWRTDSPEDHFLLERQLWSRNHWVHNLLKQTNKQTKSKSRYNTVGNRNGSWGKWSYPSEHRLCQTQTKSWIIQTNWLKLKSHFRHSSLSFQPAQTLFRWNIVRKESVCTLSSPKVTLADSAHPFMFVNNERGVLVA